MLKLAAALRTWEKDAPAHEQTPHMQAYREACFLAHKGDVARCERLCRLYARLRLSLFGCLDEVGTGRTEALRRETEGVVLRLGEIDARRLRPEMRQMCVAAQEHWGERVDIVVDMADWAAISRLLKAASRADLHDFVDLCATMPLNADTITFVRPPGLPGFVFAAAKPLFPPKMWTRVRSRAA